MSLDKDAPKLFGAGGHELQCYGHEKVRVQFDDEIAVVSAVVADVRQSILSVGRLLSRGFEMHLTGSGQLLRLPGGHTARLAVRHGVLMAHGRVLQVETEVLPVTVGGSSSSGMQPEQPPVEPKAPPAANSPRLGAESPAAGVPEPVAPDPVTVRQHALTHLPYQTWCPLCV